MAQWYVKDLSKLTDVSVQTLHHYDRIGLLKPSVRLDNGYRLYSEADLLRLQQIIALKFFGFELSQIKTLLAGNVNVLDQFKIQSQLLEEKAKTLSEASRTLKRILVESSDKSIAWETIIELIEVYRMTQQLEKGWAGKVLTPEELKQYVNLSQELQTRFSPEEKLKSEQEWAAIAKDVESNLDKDPSSPEALKIAERCLKWVFKIYGNNVKLRMAIWEKGFKGGHASEHGLSLAGVEWLDKAFYAYHSESIRNIFKMLDTQSDEEVLKRWNQMLDQMYGDNKMLKDELVQKVLANAQASEKGKRWLARVWK